MQSGTEAKFRGRDVAMFAVRSGGQAPMSSRGRAPEGLGEEGSAGAEALRSCRDKRAAFGARAGCLPCRGCGHIVSGPSVRPGGMTPGLSRPGPRAAARPECRERRCATGVRATCCHQCTASIRGPGIRGELSLAADARDGTDRPAKPLSCASRVGRGCEDDRGLGRGGDFFFFRHPGRSDVHAKHGSRHDTRARPGTQRQTRRRHRSSNGPAAHLALVPRSAAG